MGAVKKCDFLGAGDHFEESKIRYTKDYVGCFFVLFLLKIKQVFSRTSFFIEMVKVRKTNTCFCSLPK
ncbi:hypothetical protein DDZ16_03000 [Marinilabilia rubra]|uniref:Uncharacterized protein n=1 Tax=Marinilabilia rubra TaxID=2162893 RepID=A0A2U2BBY2_9BACT|nr:hypothetical protein DDZ16_03000 [Marinilabilia rubra]